LEKIIETNVVEARPRLKYSFISIIFFSSTNGMFKLSKYAFKLVIGFLKGMIPLVKGYVYACIRSYLCPRFFFFFWLKYHIMFFNIYVRQHVLNNID